MWLQNTMPVRDKYSNRYDRSSAQITMTKKDVTGGLPRTGVLTELRAGVDRTQVQAFLDVVSQRMGRKAPFYKEFEIAERLAPF
jgi:hypothetical protein